MSLLSSRPPQRLPVSSQTKAFKTTQEGLHDLPVTHASVTSPASRNAARNALPPNIHMAHSRYLQVSAQMSPPHGSFSDHPKWNSNSSHCPSPCSLLILLSIAFSPPRIWCPIPSTWYSMTVLTALSEDYVQWSYTSGCYFPKHQSKNPSNHNLNLFSRMHLTNKHWSHKLDSQMVNCPN